ncbi:hypothetical protein QR680_005025 [Steinernema hermaphroditum]|uniref:Uncharacterized protein n=1 Tax=Steinernema hermaphroditum TaxID=289476 RepID=A0AA39HST5_9BILA|nr:hypothetical protein QR680_005025 [Steinernema hermaphroditum]
MPRVAEPNVPTSRLVIRFHVRLKRHKQKADSDTSGVCSSSNTGSVDSVKIPALKTVTLATADVDRRELLRKRCTEDYRKIMETIEASETFLRRAKEVQQRLAIGACVEPQEKAEKPKSQTNK